MPVITAKTTVAAGDTSGWSVTDGIANIIVGVSGRQYSVEYNLGSTIIYRVGGDPTDANIGVVVAKANQVRVVNRGAESIDYEVFS